MSVLVPAYSDHLFLKNGSIIEGKVARETADTVTVRKADGGTETFGRAAVLRILYTKLYMGKLYVHMVDGTVFEAYMVDEDQETYTFRKELYRADEMVVKREDVLYVARKNPTGLNAGAPGLDGVLLKWRPPYNPVRHYRIYARPSNEKEFKMMQKSSKETATLNGLKGNTEYVIRVTAMDREGYESQPSNEIRITTPNFPPSMPAVSDADRTCAPDGRTCSYKISWKPSTDPDGTVKFYRVYRNDRKDFAFIGQTGKTEYVDGNLAPGARYTYTVKAVDDRGKESDGSKAPGPGPSGPGKTVFALTLRPHFIMPVGDFSYLGHGYGFLAGVMTENLLDNGIIFSLETGLTGFAGGDKKMNNSFQVPLLFGAGFRLDVSDGIFLVPSVKLGASFNSICYRGPKYYAFQSVTIKKYSFEPMAQIGLTARYAVDDDLGLDVGLHYGMIPESESFFHFFSLSAGMSYRMDW